MKSKQIKVDYLARVEGEGGLTVKIRDHTVTEVRLDVFEPPRFFEGFLRGRHFSEAPDITARICGICPMSYQIAAAQAMENAVQVTVDPQIRALRRLLLIGGMLESHALHIFMLHAPDFLGYMDALQMAKGHPDIVKSGLRLKKTGNELVTLIGGREIHPINIATGGFYRLPARARLEQMRDKLKWALDFAEKTARWTAGLTFPDFEQDYRFVALRHSDEYPLIDGSLASSQGSLIDCSAYNDYFVESHERHSNALHSKTEDGQAFLVGPLARYNLNYDRLSTRARQAAASAGLKAVCKNPFKSIIIRAVEMVQYCEDALKIIDHYQEPASAAITLQPKAGSGHSCVEAPRGVLYHGYRLNTAGLIEEAKIVSPTAQNQRMIESDIREFVTKNIDRPQEELTWQCEQAIRNYDPCISCATHCLKVKIDRL